jgi:hypothetical protein
MDEEKRDPLFDIPRGREGGVKKLDFWLDKITGPEHNFQDEDGAEDEGENLEESKKEK